VAGGRARPFALMAAAPPPFGDRRAELLSAIVDFLLLHGVSDLSLRPLAEGVGTSARLLIYHFDSKENLLAMALDQVRARILGALDAIAREAPAPSLGAALLRFWHWATRVENHGYFRLLFELDGLAMFDRLTLSAGAHQQGTMLWIGRIEVLLQRFYPAMRDSRAEATLIAAALTGLLQDRLATGDTARTDAAFARMAARLDQDGLR
jgi:AcrR family transcriptional regulator